jgi:CRP-like cAMP-binding protein
LQHRRLRQGERIITQGDPAEEFCLLTTGRLEVTVEGGDPESPPVGFIEAPSWFGELAIVTRQPRTANVTALTESEVWILPRDQFEAAFAQHPEMGRSLIRTLCARVQRKDQDFLDQSALAIERARTPEGLRAQRGTRGPGRGDPGRERLAGGGPDLRTISTHATQLTRSDSASVFLYDENQDTFEVCASYNTPEEYVLKPRNSAFWVPGAGKAAERRRSMIAARCRADTGPDPGRGRRHG